MVKKMNTRWIVAFLLFILLVGAFDAGASELRCGSRIISIGERRHEVLRKCGDPVYVEVREEVRVGSSLLLPGEEFRRIPSIVKELVTIEEWEYNFGPGQFIRYLRFENGILTRITTGDYGY